MYCVHDCVRPVWASLDCEVRVALLEASRVHRRRRVIVCWVNCAWAMCCVHCAVYRIGRCARVFCMLLSVGNVVCALVCPLSKYARASHSYDSLDRQEVNGTQPHFYARRSRLYWGSKYRESKSRETHMRAAHDAAHTSRGHRPLASHMPRTCHVIVDYTSITSGNVAVTSARKSAAAVVTGGGTPLTADAAGVGLANVSLAT